MLCAGFSAWLGIIRYTVFNRYYQIHDINLIHLKRLSADQILNWQLFTISKPHRALMACLGILFKHHSFGEWVQIVATWSDKGRVENAGTLFAHLMLMKRRRAADSHTDSVATSYRYMGVPLTSWGYCREGKWKCCHCLCQKETQVGKQWTTKVEFQAPAPSFIMISVACGGFTVRNLIGGFVGLTGF